jgi:YegS/Rv2252/BmrU family lipid kinase
MSIAIIINPIAGGKRPDAARAHAELAASVLGSCHEAGEVFVTERTDHARELASAAVQRGCRLVIAWGGDGTVNEIGSALESRETALAIVPAGSGNGLARALGVARDPRQAIVDAVSAAPRRIDAGEIAGRVFFSLAGIGFDAHVAACFDREKAGGRGLAGYVRIVARELVRYRPCAYRIDEAGSPRIALLVTLANSPQFGNGATIAPGARLDDGLLDLVIFEEVSRLRTVLGVPRLFTGGVASLRGVSIRPVKSATIESDAPMVFHVDGEPIAGGTRLVAVVKPAALRVCVR